jgi:drug/metabolite transporter (DMT)-like permease
VDGGQNIAWAGAKARPPLSLNSAVGLTLIAVIAWGFSPIGTREMVGLAQSGLPPVAFNGLRYGLASLLLAPGLWQTRGWTLQDWGLGALCGFIGLTGLLDATEPLMIVVFTAAMLRRVPSRWTFAATFLGLAGIVLLAHGSGPALGDPRGIALILSGALLWGIYCVLVTPLVNRRGALPVTSVTVIFGAIPMVLLSADQLPALVAQMDLGQWEITLALVIGTSVGAMLCWNAGSAALGAQRAGWFLYLVPVVSLIGGALLLGEPIKLVELFGGALILLSVALSQK